MISNWLRKISSLRMQKSANDIINSDPHNEWIVKIKGEWNEKILNVRDIKSYKYT